MRFGLLAVCVALLGSVVAGCHDLSSFSTHGDSYDGEVVPGDPWSAGIAAGTRLCLTLDAEHLQDQPGFVWSSDARFQASPLRPVPQLWRDPLSALTFGEGRLRNLIYVLGAATPFDDGGSDVVAFVSLMQSGDVEVRLLRGAPPLGSGPDAGASDSASVLFGVFALARKKGACSY